MAFVPDEYWLKWSVGKGEGKDVIAENLWRVGKSEKVGFKVRKKLITRDSALQGCEGIELMTVVEGCVSGANDLRYIGREFLKRGEE